ncbi:MAG: TIGR03118 family protein, partial [Chloroflexi bacterium]
TDSFLYATDFHNRRVDVFNGSFEPANAPGAFVDPKIPAGYAPFGIQNVEGTIVVTYAEQDADRHDDVAGQGHGFVDRFDTSGAFLGRVATHGQLNSPWGIAPAPAGFGAFAGDLLVGNFGDGQVSAFAPQEDGTYELVGQLRTGDHKVLTIDGLWSLQFGKGNLNNNGPTTTLFFTAGPDGESHGLFGTITAG